MKKEIIAYKAGFKYQLAHDYMFKSPLLGYNINTRFLKLNESGWLTILTGYAWDGPSGPTVDTKNFMRGSLVHDALYQLIREEKLPQDERFIADKILQMICRQDGMSKLRAWWVFTGVDKFAAGAAAAKNKKKIITAP